MDMLLDPTIRFVMNIHPWKLKTPILLEKHQKKVDTMRTNVQNNGV